MIRVSNGDVIAAALKAQWGIKEFFQNYFAPRVSQLENILNYLLSHPKFTDKLSRRFIGNSITAIRDKSGISEYGNVTLEIENHITVALDFISDSNLKKSVQAHLSDACNFDFMSRKESEKPQNELALIYQARKFVAYKLDAIIKSSGELIDYLRQGNRATSHLYIKVAAELERTHNALTQFHERLEKHSFNPEVFENIAIKGISELSVLENFCNAIRKNNGSIFDDAKPTKLGLIINKLDEKLEPLNSLKAKKDTKLSLFSSEIADICKAEVMLAGNGYSNQFSVNTRSLPVLKR